MPEIQTRPDVNADAVPRPSRLPWLAPALAVAAAVYTLAGLAAMFVLSPKVLYADAWRYTGHFLTTPWPWNVLQADNGHREIFPNIVRVLELEGLQANQWLQLVVGALLACATVLVLVHGIRREPAGPAARASAILFAVIGIFWLGNERSLTHGNESVHAYLVTLCLVAGCWLLSDRTADLSPMRLASALLLGMVAAFSFGSGIACFVAFAVVLLLRRARWQSLVALGAGAIAVLTAHLLLGETGVEIMVGWSPVEQATQLLRWLSAPALYVAWPLLDSDAAAAIPVASLREASMPLALGFERLFGVVQTALWPNALLSLGGIAWLLASSHAAWRHDASRMQQVALGVAWFALAVGVLVCLSRADYFVQQPQQVVAPRYVPWSSLFWSGLGMATVLRMPSASPGRSAACALLVAVLLLPSQVWMAMLAHRAQSLAELTAVGAAVGVLAEDSALGENVVDEITTALPLLRQSGASIFAWPETRAMGQPVPARAHAVEVSRLRVEPVVNRWGSPGFSVSFDLGISPCPRLLLTDNTGRVSGMAVRMGRGDGWQGWARREAGPQSRVVALCDLTP